MEAFFASLSEFCSSKSGWVYVFIFCGKIFEVSVSTLRIVLINRGIRVVGSVIAVLEVTLWLIVASTVLVGYQSDPLKILFYALAFGLGNFMGSWLDERLAFGLSSVQVVVPDEADSNQLCLILREKGFGVTTMDVHGKDDSKHFMLLLMLKRKLLKEAMDTINRNCEKAVIMVSDVKSQKGGYLRSPVPRRRWLLMK